MIEDAYTLGASLGLAVWCEDEAGPFQAVPHPGASWRPEGRPGRQPHEYVRGGWPSGRQEAPGCGTAWNGPASSSHNTASPGDAPDVYASSINFFWHRRRGR